MGKHVGRRFSPVRAHMRLIDSRARRKLMVVRVGMKLPPPRCKVSFVGVYLSADIARG